MAIIWADDFSMYGYTTAPMLDGIYAQVGGAISDAPGLPGKKCIGGDGTFNDGYTVRVVLPSAVATCGMGIRQRIGVIPTKDALAPVPFQFRNSGNASILSVNVNPTGGLTVRSGSSSGAILGETAVPVVTPNSWPHLECKFTPGAAGAGSIEIRVNGKTVLDLPSITTAADLVAQVRFGYDDNDIVIEGLDTRFTDLTIWDTSGSVDNDFLGQCSVFWRKPIATLVAGGWLSNADADADETVAKPRLANILTATGAIISGNQVRISNTYYNWTSGNVDAGAPAGTSANPWLVALGGSDAQSLSNLYDAIGATGSPGVTYSTALTAHTTATPFGLTETTIAVIPTDGVTTSMTFSETGANTSWLSTVAFLSRIHDAIRMSADYIPAVKATGSVTFSGLPVADETVTINGQAYVFKAAAAGPLEVTIGADADGTAANFAAKVNANSIVVTAANVGGVVTLTAISAGAGGDAITLAEAATNTVVSGATMTGGVDVTYPDAFEVALEPLPDDVTSIRAVIPIVRAAKIDGGDGNIQASFGVSVPSYDAGPDTPITTAFTFWGNPTMPFVSEINPLTAAPWTPGEFNLGARMKVARTL